MTNATWERGVRNGVHKKTHFNQGDLVKIHPKYFTIGLSEAYVSRGSDFVYTVDRASENSLYLKEGAGFWSNPSAELIPACLPPEDEFDSNSLSDLL